MGIQQRTSSYLSVRRRIAVCDEFLPVNSLGSTHSEMYVDAQAGEGGCHFPSNSNGRNPQGLEDQSSCLKQVRDGRGHRGYRIKSRTRLTNSRPSAQLFSTGIALLSQTYGVPDQRGVGVGTEGKNSKGGGGRMRHSLRSWRVSVATIRGEEHTYL